MNDEVLLKQEWSTDKTWYIRLLPRLARLPSGCTGESPSPSGEPDGSRCARAPSTIASAPDRSSTSQGREGCRSWEARLSSSLDAVGHGAVAHQVQGRCTGALHRILETCFSTAVEPVELWASDDRCVHELFEAMTDPDPSSGWTDPVNAFASE